MKNLIWTKDGARMNMVILTQSSCACNGISTAADRISTRYPERQSITTLASTLPCQCLFWCKLVIVSSFYIMIINYAVHLPKEENVNVVRSTPSLLPANTWTARLHRVLIPLSWWYNGCHHVIDCSARPEIGPVRVEVFWMSSQLSGKIHPAQFENWLAGFVMYGLGC